MTDNAYIALIRFVDEATKQTGVVRNEACVEFMRTNFPEYGAHTIGNMIGLIVTSVQTERGTEYMLSAEAYFHLLEHEELQEARSASKWAMFFATAALIVSIVVGTLQLTTPTNVVIDAAQIDQLKLSAINMNQ